MILHYRKKPVAIETVIWTGDNVTEMVEFSPNCFTYHRDNVITLQIVTLEGTMTATIGDYIIKGIKNEVYPCKSDIFLLTYEPINLDKDGSGN
jgi:hypothetical protein